MKSILICSLLFFSGYVKAQEVCPLQTQKNIANYHLSSTQALAYPDIDPVSYNEQVEYEKAPLENIGSIHDAQSNVICSGMYRGPYTLTHSECIDKIKTSGKDYYFTMFFDGEQYTSLIIRSTSSGNLGGFLTEDSLPSKANTVQVGFDFSRFLNQSAWVIKGVNGRTTTSYSIVDDCEVTHVSGVNNYYKCSQNLAYKTGAFMMGNLCNEWFVVGIKSSEDNYILPFNKQSVLNIASALGQDCNFTQTELCSDVKKKKANVRKWLPRHNTKSYDDYRRYKKENRLFIDPKISKPVGNEFFK